MNLLRLGYEETAEQLHAYLAKLKQPRLVWVKQLGDVKTSAPDCDRYSMNFAFEWLIGCFTPATPIEVIEDCLLERQRELTAHQMVSRGEGSQNG